MIWTNCGRQGETLNKAKEISRITKAHPMNQRTVKILSHNRWWFFLFLLARQGTDSPYPERPPTKSLLRRLCFRPLFPIFARKNP
jgi:hypothetical protein